MEAANLVRLRLIAEQTERYALVERVDLTLDRLFVRGYSDPQRLRVTLPPLIDVRNVTVPDAVL